MLKSLVHSHAFQKLAAAIAAGYIRLVWKTTRYTMEPAGVSDSVLADDPVIFAVWHGQHFLTHFALPKGMTVAVLVSRNRDAEINSMVLEGLGIKAVRGSGGRAAQMHRRGGVKALREMIRILAEGDSLGLTADVPKVSRQCGEGIIALAKHSGRPIYPVAVVNKWRIDVNSWDHASFGLPFGRGAIVVGEPVRVAASAEKDEQEAARQTLEARLDEIHARAYARLGSRDPGAKPGSSV